ncbi:MAG TPA: flagellar biosynthesis anti-sigma factor FlgM [Nitrospiraceae bacterium]|nr:MAG: flagellar biosynthesis anti-sigma factor FlgM [Nitrospirae bacterium GWA2_46_11]OGW22962.1 MAG: flagellar biosynthesis anti-sigma factor FlgM [Nitrospirae bacterium GWB2_47_37]HAK89956.1 flagellar biosynthesis anti-sigma factor FlgM [Nitrospiraceae bacterium]HCL82027.1 flagellar biosynthesis anti-sigma factor FlgM [Nitrospiraceae bacterium]HCZ11107.1 flagellar biosynthesis anti-sigma factor FlgM [Nitrospiraceae bacterium]
MRITDRVEGVGNVQKTDKAKEKATPERAEEVVSKDQVTVSDRAKEIARLQLEVSKLPEVRTDRVEEVKNAINAGTYEVKGSEVAGKLLEEAVIDSLI